MATKLEILKVVDGNKQEYNVKALTLGKDSPAALALAKAVNAIVAAVGAKLPDAARAYSEKGEKLDVEFEKAVMARRAERAIAAFISDSAVSQTYIEVQGLPKAERGRRSAGSEESLDLGI